MSTLRARRTCHVTLPCMSWCDSVVMTNIGIIGSGAIGSGLARLAVDAGHEVLIANSRGPESLANLVGTLGERATAGSVNDATGFGDLTILAIPLAAYAALPSEKFADRVVLSTGNYYPSRDGRIAELDSLEFTTAEYEQRLLRGAVTVKAFNNILAHHIPLLARPMGSPDRSALAVYGDDADAEGARRRDRRQLWFRPARCRYPRRVVAHRARVGGLHPDLRSRPRRILR